MLTAFLRQRVLVAFDFDGTLAPIVSNPSDAAISSKTRRLLQEVARHYPSAVISGRTRREVLERVSGIPLRAVFGNHGIEPVRNPRVVRRQVEAWQRRLVQRLPSIPGLVVEDKRVTLALHYRQAEHRSQVRQLLLAHVTQLPGARIMEGKMVVNLLPARTGNKGTALVRLCRRLRCQSALYVGDDDNDEDVFALASKGPISGRLIGIRVGRSRKSQAQYYLPGQSAIDELLATMVLARMETTGARSVAKPCVTGCAEPGP
jgi:trehalose 6-phosphate phosphatase